MDTRVKERLATQIEPDGRQPKELERTRTWSYSAMNLEGWFALARLAREAGVDLWGYRTRDGRSIRAALDYLVKFADGARWPYQQITPTDRGELIPLLREAAIEWKDPSYAALADRLSTSTRDYGHDQLSPHGAGCARSALSPEGTNTLPHLCIEGLSQRN